MIINNTGRLPEGANRQEYEPTHPPRWRPQAAASCLTAAVMGGAPANYSISAKQYGRPRQIERAFPLLPLPFLSPSIRQHLGLNERTTSSGETRAADEATMDLFALDANAFLLLAPPASISLSGLPRLDCNLSSPARVV